MTNYSLVEYFDRGLFDKELLRLATKGAKIDTISFINNHFRFGILDSKRIVDDNFHKDNPVKTMDDIRETCFARMQNENMDLIIVKIKAGRKNITLNYMFTNASYAEANQEIDRSLVKYGKDNNCRVVILSKDVNYFEHNMRFTTLEELL